jgi:hypothetical protein
LKPPVPARRLHVLNCRAPVCSPHPGPSPAEPGRPKGLPADLASATRMGQAISGDFFALLALGFLKLVRRTALPRDLAPSAPRRMIALQCAPGRWTMAAQFLRGSTICRWLNSSINALNRRSPNVSPAISNHLCAIRRSVARAAESVVVVAILRIGPTLQANASGPLE